MAYYPHMEEVPSAIFCTYVQGIIVIPGMKEENMKG